MKRILFIVNPISGRGKKDKIEQLIVDNLDHERFEYSLAYTEYAGHAAELTRKAVEDSYDIVAAVGGDGTVNEVARALVHSTTALAILPSGSGNGLARHLQIPMDLSRAINIINKDCVHVLDYGRINGNPFFCTCGMGFDAFLAQKFAEAGKRGLKTYLEKAITDGLWYKPEEYEITYTDEDGQECEITSTAFLITCANATQFGNNAMIAPHASMKDGLLDVVMIKPFHNIEAPIVGYQLFSGKLPSSSYVEHYFKASRIMVKRVQSGPLHFDGDPFDGEEIVDVELIPSDFRVMVNPEANGHNETGLLLLGEYMQEWRSLINKKTLGRLKKKP